MHINSMPDLVLRLIFAKLPLRDLIIVGRVCALWKSYQLDITRKVHSLTLLFGNHLARHLISDSCFTLKYRDLLLKDDGKRMYLSQHLSNWFHINYSEFLLNLSEDKEGSKELFKIFPNITTLEIAIEYPHLSAAMPLLAKWAPILTSLKMYFKNSLKVNQLAGLLEVINSMKSLEHLTLEIPSICNNYNCQLNVPILGKLRELYFNFDFNNFEESLVGYSNDNLKLGLKLYQDDLQSLRRRSPSLAGKIAHLLLLPPELDRMEMYHIVQSFHSLTCFDFDLQTSENLLTEGLNFLLPLNQLTHLHLHMSNFNQLQSPNHVSRDQVVQLSSVQVLTITTTLQSTYSFESNQWAHVFPSVQVIELNLTLRVPLYRNPIPLSLSEQEIRQSPFLQCPKLHHIFINLRDNCREQDYTERIVKVNQRKIIIKVSK